MCVSVQAHRGWNTDRNVHAITFSLSVPFCVCNGEARREGMPRSTFGPQPYSSQRSAASYGFGKATREQAARAGERRPSTGRDSPAPNIYILPASMGAKQPDGRKVDPPIWVCLKLLESGHESRPAQLTLRVGFTAHRALEPVSALEPAVASVRVLPSCKQRALLACVMKVTTLPV